MAIPKSMSLRWRVFADGKTLLDDLSFSYYFHASRTNQLLHICTFFPILFSIFYLLHCAQPLVAAAAFAGYASVFAVWDPVVALAYAPCYVGPAILHTLAPAALHTVLLALCCGVLLLLPPLQVLGHVVFERRLPAFRAFEAAFTTPFLLALLALHAVVHYQPDLVAEVQRRSSQWKSYKQRTF